MYTPRAFAETDLAGLDALIERDPFATLVTVSDGLPQASHLPVLYARDGDRVELRGHWSRANPQARLGGDALAIVHGPHAYVSPTWYADKQAEARVPTWNYAVAHLRGRLEVSDDVDFLADIVARLGDRHEAAVGGDWRFDRDDPREAVQPRGIVGFRLVATSIELKFKLNQNHPAANVRGAAAALAAGPGDAARAVADLMLARLARRDHRGPSP